VLVHNKTFVCHKTGKTEKEGSGGNLILGMSDNVLASMQVV